MSEYMNSFEKKMKKKNGNKKHAQFNSNVLPLKIGAILNTPRPPIVSICPNANSMKNIGIPANISVKKYGIKNAPPPFL